MNSGAHAVLLTVTALAVPLAAAGIAAIVTPAARAGTAMSTPATDHGRLPASLSQRPSPRAGDRVAAAGDGRAAAGEAPAMAGTGFAAGAAGPSGATPAASGLAASGRAAGLTARPAFTNAGMTTTR